MKRQISVLLASLVVLGVCAAVAVAASSPTVTTGAASSIKDTSAVLNGRVNPNGSATKYWFEWGPTTAYGAVSDLHNAGKGTADVNAKVTATNLFPGTTYHYRMFAQNLYGTTAGADKTFKTKGHPLPGVLTGSATGISQSGATVTGAVVPNGTDTSWYFQYSCGTTYCQTSPGTVPATSGPVNVSQSINGLAAGTTFSYRLVGIHSGFPLIYGAFQQFSTYPVARPYPGTRTFVSPRRARNKPYVFQVFGSIVPSSSFLTAPQCAGNIGIRFLVGARQIAARTTPVQSNCGFFWLSTFRHTFPGTPGGGRPASQQMRIQITFQGNGYLAPKRARIHVVTLG